MSKQIPSIPTIGHVQALVLHCLDAFEKLTGPQLQDALKGFDADMFHNQFSVMMNSLHRRSLVKKKKVNGENGKSCIEWSLTKNGVEELSNLQHFYKTIAI